MLISSIALLAFMFFVSFHVWPQAVLAISFLAGVLVTLQYLLFGAHRIVLGIRWVLKKIGAVFVRLFSRREEAEPAEKENNIDSPKLTTGIDKDKIGDEGKEKENEKLPS
jgi:CBS domain containing-hemolysin-like protein